MMFWLCVVAYIVVAATVITGWRCDVKNYRVMRDDYSARDELTIGVMFAILWPITLPPSVLTLLVLTVIRLFDRTRSTQ